MQENVSNVGARIKKLRTAKGMTLKEMVEYTGLSIGYLSNLERNITSPTLAALANICDALDTTIVDLLSVKIKNRVLLRREDVHHQEYPTLLQTSDVIDFNDNRVVGQIITIQPGIPEENISWRHAYSEICTVLKGTLIVNLEGIEYRLEAGDSIAIETKKKHALQNIGDGECVSYWAHFKNDN